MVSKYETIEFILNELKPDIKIKDSTNQYTAIDFAKVRKDEKLIKLLNDYSSKNKNNNKENIEKENDDFEKENIINEKEINNENNKKIINLFIKSEKDNF